MVRQADQDGRFDLFKRQADLLERAKVIDGEGSNGPQLRDAFGDLVSF